MATDSLQTFLFENTDIRGAIVVLEHSFGEMLQQQGYDPLREQLLGQFVAANILLTSHLKFDGLLSLQARSEGVVPLVMSECTHELNFRGIVSGESTLESSSLRDILANGTLAITIQPKHGQRYQGVVPLQADTLAQCLQVYFAQSEQLPTWFMLTEANGRVCGLMLQAMPAQLCMDEEQREEDWNRITHLASTLTVEEMTRLDNEALLYRLYHEEQVRLFEPQPVRFHCSCSRERTERALLNLGINELQQILEDEGEISTQCQFCHKTYHFTKEDVQQLILAGEQKNMH